MIGTIVAVRREVAGSGLAAALVGGETAITVDWSIDFTPGERRLLMIGTPDADNETLAYTAVDEDTEVLTIEAPGVVLPWEIGDPVTPLDATGKMAEETWTIDVDMGDGGEAVPCRPSHALQDKLREDEDYVGLRCEVVGDEVTTLYDKGASIEPSAFQAPLFVGYLASNQSVPTGATYSTITGWVPKVLRGGMQYDAGTSSVIVPLSGWYATSDSAVAWMFNATGRRAVQPLFNTAAGPVGGGEFKQDASSDPTQQTTPVSCPLTPLQAGESATLTALQTSGGALNLVGTAAGTATFFSVEYRGPL